MTSLSRRIFVPELMDSDDADPVKLIRTVRQFAFINRLFSRSHSILSRYIINENQENKELITIVDVGAGGGDIMCRLAKSCRKAGIAVKIVCLDSDERILEDTRTRCRLFDEIDVCYGDVFDLMKFGTFDYVYCNNFLHHFNDEQVPQVLSVLYDMADKMLIVSDLHRSFFAYVGFALFGRLFLHGSFARIDGCLSIRKGFLVEELNAYVKELAIDHTYEVTKMLPARVVLSIEKNRENF